MKLSGLTFIHNGVEFDYCFVESIRSMLGVCDEVVVVEAGSTDSTRIMLDSIHDDRLKIVPAPWRPAPLVRQTNTDWLLDLAEIGRSHLTGDAYVYVQGDEVLHEDDYGLIKQQALLRHAVSVERLNFWVDLQHLAPHNKVCGYRIVRLAPRSHAVDWGTESISADRYIVSPIRLFHYGFVRTGPGFRKKSEIMLKNYVGSIDPVIYEYEKTGPGALRGYFPDSELVPYTGTSHPAVVVPWLKERSLL